MKKLTFKNVLDGFRQSVQIQSKPEQEIIETLRPEYFQLKKTFRHGFPHSPTAISYDPVQKLLAIGDKMGSLRILGRPGVDTHVLHEGEGIGGVTFIEFLVNEGAMVTATSDDTLHLWNLRQKVPQIVQSLKFQRERITCLHLPMSSKWLYVGTEKGNIHVVHIESFALSGYVINWNKAIDVIRKTHPGPVIQLVDNPLDSNKLLIAYECGLMVLWDMRGKVAEFRWQSQEPLRSVSWHHEGKYFVSSHTDGSICTWPLRLTPTPQFQTYPHAKTNKDGKLETCKTIHKVELKTSRSTGETYTIFSGGLSIEKSGKSQCITVMQGKSTTVLEMEHPVIDFITICESPWASDMQEPYAIAVLLQNDLVLIDLLTPGFPCFESPYPMDLHESQVTCCIYLADCPSELVPAFYSVGRSPNNRRTGFSEREWPISGGEWSPASCSYSEIIITGHQDGSVKFWDASAGTLQILYKLKTAKIFEKPKLRSMDNSDYDPFAIQMMHLCPESRMLCVAGSSGHVILFEFRRTERVADITVLEIPINIESNEEAASPECEFIPRSLPKQEAGDADEKKFEKLLKVREGPQRKLPGFQAHLVCLIPNAFGLHNGQITALSMNSSYGLLCYGTEHSLVIVDMVQKTCVLNVCNADLYGSDPYSKLVKSPKKIESASSGAEEGGSPNLDQLPLSCSPQRTPSLTPNLELEQDAIDDVSPNIQIGINDEMPSDEAPKPEAVRERRKSSWKVFLQKSQKQISKVNLKISNTFGGPSAMKPVASGPTFYDTMADITPVEVAPVGPPDDNDDSSDTESPMDTEIDKSDIGPTEVGKEALETNISSDDESEITKSTETLTPYPGQAPLDLTPVDEQIVRVADASLNEGAGPSRPSDLQLFQSDVKPVAPPRTKKMEKRDQRLLSVPNIKYTNQNRDGRSKSTKAQNSTFAESFMRRFSRVDKLDSSFSRSRSSSMSSLDNIASETISCLVYADSYTKKSDTATPNPTLWIGTNMGSVLTISLSLEDGEARCTQTTIISMFGGPLTRLKGAILSMAFLDSAGAIIPNPFEVWRDDNKRERTSTRGSLNRMSPTMTSGDSFGDRQFIVITSEKQARVIALPSQNVSYRQQIMENGYVVKAEVINIKDSVCLACYASNGHLMIYTLPSLKLLLDIDFLPLIDLRISKTFCFGNKGHGLYLATPTEIQKFTICSDFCQYMKEMCAELFTARDMPEAPKEGFFKSLLGGGQRNLDREELFGETSGKPNRSVAKHIPGTALENLNQRSNTAASAIAQAHQLALERGDKLNQLVERTERMSNESHQFSSAAHTLMGKYKDKKWYQI